jgi:hypothetical protein
MHVRQLAGALALARQQLAMARSALAFGAEVAKVSEHTRRRRRAGSRHR